MEEQDFVKIDLNDLPIRDDYNMDDETEKRIYNVQRKAIELSTNGMMKFKNYTNVEIKQKYGTANLDKIINYEERFKLYVTTLNDWAEQLNKAGNYSDAEKVLNHAVGIGSEYSKTYILLCDTYVNMGDISKVNDIIKSVQDIEEVSKNRVLNYCNIIPIKYSNTCN